MSGYRTVEEQLGDVLAAVHPLPVETLAVADARGMTVRETARATVDIPVFDNSAMDGYAVRLADLQQSMTLSVAGKSFAGNPFQGKWVAQSAVRIMTGAMIPEGADAVVDYQLKH